MKLKILNNIILETKWIITAEDERGYIVFGYADSYSGGYPGFMYEYRLSNSDMNWYTKESAEDYLNRFIIRKHFTVTDYEESNKHCNEYKVNNQTYAVRQIQEIINEAN